MLDKNGNPVINQFGHVVSARLTKEDEQAINTLAAKGYSRKAICAELNLSERRVITHLNKPKVAEAIALEYLVEIQNEKIDALTHLVASLVAINVKMESRISNMQTELQRTKHLAMRNRIGREKSERQSRSQRQELTRLKDQLWKRTGKRT